MKTQAFYKVPFGKATMEFGPQPGISFSVAEAGGKVPLPNPASVLSDALRRPIGAPPLAESARKAKRVCIVFTDSTRACPDRLLVSGILGELLEAGIHGDAITLLCGVGMHRPSTSQEKTEKLGEDICRKYNIVDHDARNPAQLVFLGNTQAGIPIAVNRTAFESDLIIATGIVEPHQYAGYSGGGKTLAVGAGGEDFIAHTHGPSMVDHPGTRLGVINANPFQDALQEAARRAGLSFIVNVVLDSEKRVVKLAAGHPERCFFSLVDSARKIFEVPIPRQFDAAIAGVGHPKDVNLYQASRAVSYLHFAPVPVVKEGGVYILPAPAPEGAGEGLGERRFLDTMKGAGDMASLLAELRVRGYPAGAQRAFVMAKVMEKRSVIVVGSKCPELVKELRMIPAGTMEEAFSLTASILGKKRIEALIVPHALLTLPVVTAGTSPSD